MKALGLVCSVSALCAAVLFLVSCGSGQQELSTEEIAFQKKAGENALLAKTVLKPGGADYEKGTPGGEWQDSLVDDPKTFNPAISKDGESNAIINRLEASLLRYDAYKKEWEPNAASLEITTDEKTDTMVLTYTLRDDLYWSTLAQPTKKIKVTSDDAVFWYNEIDGDPSMETSGYTSQFLTMPDKSKKHIDIEKINDQQFRFKFPRIVAFPELASSMSFGPRYIFEPVKKAKGPKGVKELWSVDTNPATIPSMGPYLIESYKPGIGVTLVRNKDYFKKDAFGQPIPYIEKITFKIVPNVDTEKLKFLAGELDMFSLRPQDMEEMIQKTPRDYTVYYQGPYPGSALFTWNENPKTVPPVKLAWFSNPQFRQAMSCFFNRDRVISQVYRNLASPAYGFFSSQNPYYNPEIRTKFTYNPEQGKKLLAEIGMKKGADGLLRDSKGNQVSFDITVVPSSNTLLDMCNIYIDELKQAGISVTLKPVDFQKFLSKLSETYDWDATVVSFGSEQFPTQGSNVWPSDGDLHVWFPHQDKPATAWEARVDELYHLGEVTRDKAKATTIWNEYQQTLLDNVAFMYLIHRDSYLAVRDKWANVRADQLGAPDLDYIYLKKP